MKNKLKEKSWYPDVFKKGEEKDIVDLMEEDIKARGSGAIFDNEHWQWKFKDNNAGFFPNWIHLAKSKATNFIGGHYTVIPAFLKANGNTVLSCQSVDTMTHKTFRRQGVFTVLANACYNELIKSNVDIIYGYPNDSSYPGFVKKLEWDHIFTVDEFGYILDVPKLVDYKYKNFFKNVTVKVGLSALSVSRKFSRNVPTKNRFQFQTIPIDDVDHAIIEDLISKNYKYYLEKSKDYFKWRYVKNPHDREVMVKKVVHNKKIVGYYILKFKNYPHRNNIRAAHIMELILDQDVKEIYNATLNDIFVVSKERKMSMIYTYSHDKQFDYLPYKKFGFMKLDNKNFIIRINKNKQNYEGIFNANNWFITQGDSDRA